MRIVAEATLSLTPQATVTTLVLTQVGLRLCGYVVVAVVMVGWEERSLWLWWMWHRLMGAAGLGLLVLWLQFQVMEVEGRRRRRRR
jgi:hypothetical protein